MPEMAPVARGSGLLRSTSVVSALTLLSRITGLVRDIVFSRLFGAGLLMDAFFVAFKIPNLMRRFFAEGAFAQAFVPVLAEYRATRSPAEVKALVDGVAGTLGVILFAVTAVGVVAAPVLILIFAPGFVIGDGADGADGGGALAIDMLRLTLPYLLFISLTAFAGAVLNTHRRFVVPAFTPVLLNLVMIAFAVGIAPHVARPGLGLAAGVFAAGLVQLAFQLPSLQRLRLLPRPRWAWRDSGVARVLRLMTPVLFGASVVQINLLIDMQIASFLDAGSISWLYYSDRLMEFPLGVVGIALATVILPSLAEQHTMRSPHAFAATLDWALKWVLVIALPAAIGLWLLAAPMLATILHGGEFDAFDVEMSTASLAAYAPGLLGFIGVKVLASAYFARQDTRTPVRIGMRTVLLNLLLNVIFVTVSIRTGAVPPHAALALATALAGLTNAGLLWQGLRASGAYRTTTRWTPLLLQVVTACIAMTVVIGIALARLGDWLTMPSSTRIVALALCVLGGAAVYAAAAAAVGLRPAALMRPDGETDDLSPPTGAGDRR